MQTRRLEDVLRQLRSCLDTLEPQHLKESKVSYVFSNATNILAVSTPFFNGHWVLTWAPAAVSLRKRSSQNGRQVYDLSNPRLGCNKLSQMLPSKKTPEKSRVK